jgi:hypothetical protein
VEVITLNSILNAQFQIRFFSFSLLLVFVILCLTPNRELFLVTALYFESFVTD